MAKIKKVLVANRGEIAVRIIRALKELGIVSVAVYSDADRDALHVIHADEVEYIGPPEPLKSYLDIEKIISAAKKHNADAIHPGYGFLAENPEFAQAVLDAGLIFIGPKPETIRLLGNKVESRQKLVDAGVPLIPGMLATGLSMEEYKKEAEKIGYPVMIKAAAGGGGKGMRIVYSPDKLEAAISAAQREAKSAFGDESVYIEKYIENPRHIEIQILGDKFGNYVHLFERECSIQRRHQKIIEETPSGALTMEKRMEMGETAIRVAKTVGYESAGTVEFLFDKHGNFYFLEVNTRIQVEHPITEMVTCRDLVKEQINIAEGNPLSFKQEELSQHGHAIECRIYAEDPEKDFMPSPGKIIFVSEPAGPGIRVDSGIYSGVEVPPYYDPILSKLIVWGRDREEARRRMIEALKNYVILGIKTNIPYLIDILEHPEFIKGNTFTTFIPDHMQGWKPKSDVPPEVFAAIEANEETAAPSIKITSDGRKKVFDPWLVVGNWRIVK